MSNNNNSNEEVYYNLEKAAVKGIRDIYRANIE
jgi:hypothetical protein